MRLLINGGKSFANEQVFRRAMGVAMYDMQGDTRLTLLLSGSHKTNDIARQFVNLTERSFTARGMKLDLTYVSVNKLDWDSVDKVLVFVSPPYKSTPVVKIAEEHGKDVDIYRY